MNRFLQALIQLLPPGWAFPRGESVLMRTLTAFAQQLADRLCPDLLRQILQPLSVLKSGRRIVNRAGTDNDHQPVVFSVEYLSDCIASALDGALCFRR